MIVENGSHLYHVGDLVAETPAYRLYLCSLTGTGQTHLLQIARDMGQNGGLDRAAYFLKILAQRAEEIEKEYARVKVDPQELLNYQLCFPELVDSFKSAAQGDRRINILAFRGVEDVRRMVPLYNIVHRDRRRVDLRTSVWIMGKLLKILAFVHGAGISMGDVSLGSILIEPERHYVVMFNWADARKYSDGLPNDVVSKEVMCAAECVLHVLGIDENRVPDDGTEQFEPYFQCLVGLAARGSSNAETAHRTFYEFVDGLWSRGYYPFTSLPLIR